MALRWRCSAEPSGFSGYGVWKEEGILLESGARVVEVATGILDRTAVVI